MKVIEIDKYQFVLLDGGLLPRCPKCHLIVRVHSAKGLKRFYARHKHIK